MNGLTSQAFLPARRTRRRLPLIELKSRRSAGCEGEVAASAIPTAKWTTQEWLHFLKSLPLPQEKAGNTAAAVLDRQKMAELDQAFHLTQSGNSEIAFQWLIMSIKNQLRTRVSAARRISHVHRPAQVHQTVVRRVGQNT